MEHVRICVDTNVIYNILFKTEKSGSAKELLKKNSDKDLYITVAKGYPKEIGKVDSFLEEFGIETLVEEIDRKNVMKTAKEYRLLPSDAIIALTCKHNGISVILSFDTDFDRIPWLRRESIDG